MLDSLCLMTSGRDGSLTVMGFFLNRQLLGWVFAAGTLAVGCGCAWGQAAPPAGQSTVVELPTPLLPTNDKLVVNDTAAAVPADKPELAAILAESGLKRTETRAVVPSGWVRAYQFTDATGAAAAFSYLRQGGKPVSGDKVNASEEELPDGNVVFLSGVSVVLAHITVSGTLNSVLFSVNSGLPKTSGRRGIAPTLPSLLPKTGLILSSERYALGPVQYQQAGGKLPANILGWDKSAEVVMAQYDGRGGKGLLTLLIYPTPQIAGERGRAITDAVNQRGAAAFGGVKLRRDGPMIEMASNGFTQAQAQALVESVHLNEQVTFDKAMPTEFRVEIKKTVSLLQSIAIFTGVAILAALVLGVFLGGARAGIRVMQGKPAASEPEFLTIDLRGRPEPLKQSTTSESGTTQA